MSKFFGAIGFAVDSKEGRGSNDGIVKEVPVIERIYYGDKIQNVKRFENGTDINDDFKLNVRISIVADDYANENLYAMKYVDIDGTLWKVSSVEPVRPRLIISIGGLYNGPTPRSST